MVTPGNYPQPIWNTVERIIKGMETAQSFQKFELDSGKIKKGYITFLDIHNFSRFCESNKGDTMIKFLKEFYLIFSKQITAFNEKKEMDVAVIYKYIGDAILFASFNVDIKELIKFGANLIKLYKERFMGIYQPTNLAVLISKVECYEGLILGDNYNDYSIWGKNINSSFKYLKRHDFEGKVAITPDIFDNLNDEYKNKFKIDGLLTYEGGK